jgi:predicted ATPase
MSLALGVDGSGDGVFASLFAGLRSRQLLLVLDGCESVIASAAYLVRQLLSNLNGPQVLATSREPLRIEVSACSGCGPWISRHLQSGQAIMSF